MIAKVAPATKLRFAGVCVANEIVCVAWETVKPCVTDIAALVLASPAWLAVMLQVPTVNKLSVATETVQTDGVLDVSETARLDVAVAVRLIGDVVNGCDAGPGNEMV